MFDQGTAALPIYRQRHRQMSTAMCRSTPAANIRVNVVKAGSDRVAGQREATARAGRRIRT